MTANPSSTARLQVEGHRGQRLAVGEEQAKLAGLIVLHQLLQLAGKLVHRRILHVRQGEQDDQVLAVQRARPLQAKVQQMVRGRKPR